jgi:hypothetical protein
MHEHHAARPAGGSVGPYRTACGRARDGAVVAVRQADANAAHPDVRVIQLAYAPTDAGCCRIRGWDAARAQLQLEGWTLGNV